MKYKQHALLAVDASVNLILGLVLILYPVGVLQFLGLPPTNTYFYATILGGVIFGIGIALCVELWGASLRMRGLGLGGAIAINLCGAGVLLAWLTLSDLDIPLRGQIILWLVVVIVLGLSIAEIAVSSLLSKTGQVS
jgi:hypothetical protein